ncbi:MAG: hypothetical protein Q8O13_03375 [Candidatus Omnitrophota bacterium]|nr:hypothetical protein [Candidatus Omnitrophota bacterium]
MISNNLQSPAINEYSIFFCRGPWFRYIVDFLCISPVTTLLGLAFFFLAITDQQFHKDCKILYFLLMFLVIFALLSSFDFNKNVRYAIYLDTPIRLFAVLFIFETLKKIRISKMGLSIVLILCLIDYFNFINLFYFKNIYDPISWNLLKDLRFIP